MIRLKRFAKSIWCVWFLLVAWWLVVGVIQWIRYQHDGFRALDLSIYTQVLWNLSHGYGLASSIQGHNYFADHFEPVLFLLAPLFRVWSSPLMLLWLQTLCIGLAVFPLRRISANILGKDWQNIPPILFLLHIVTWNIALFEFHVYALALPLFLWVIASYMEKRFWQFLFGLALAALLREDILLVVIFFGLVPMVQRRSTRWWFWPILIGGAGALLALVVQSHLPGVPLQNKYYPWLSEFASGHFTQGFALLYHLITRLSPYTMIVVAVLAFGGLVVCGWEWWIPIIPILVGFAFTNRSVNTILVIDHHAAVTTAFFWAALIAGTKRVIGWAPRFTLEIVSVVCAILFLPWIFVWGAQPWVTPQVIAQDTTQLEQQIGSSDGVLASGNLLPQLAARQVAQWSWYVFKGHDESNQSLYQLDSAVRWALFDSNELSDFRANLEYLPEQEKKFKSILNENFSFVDSVGPVVLLKRGNTTNDSVLDKLVSVASHPQAVPQTCDENHTFSLFGQPTLEGSTLKILVQVLNPGCWKQFADTDDDEPLFQIVGSGQEISVLLGYGFVEPAALQPGDIVTTTIQLPDRILADKSSVIITGVLIHPIGIQLARNQSIARTDSIRGTFFSTTLSIE